MALVFIHGVTVRKGPDYDATLRARDSFFRHFALAGLVPDAATTKIFNPYWGDDGATFHWNHASLPGEGIEELGPEDDLPATILSQAPVDTAADPKSVLLRVARQSLPEAIDLLWSAAVPRTNEQQVEGLAALAAAALDYAAQNPHPAWLDAVSNDRQFLRDLEQQIEQHSAARATEGTATEQLGLSDVWNKLRETGARLENAAGRFASDFLVDKLRANLNRQITLFVGDVFVYLSARGTPQAPGPIVQTIVNDLEAARAAEPDGKLIVVAHSMGGNIVYDILTHFRPDIHVDVLATAGSQVGLFEEMKLFPANKDFIPANPRIDRVDKPANVGCWINVFDLDDILGFATEGIFRGVHDFRYATGATVLSAHSSYFVRPTFHERLRERIRGLCS
jgi:hypothetical protein